MFKVISKQMMVACALGVMAGVWASPTIANDDPLNIRHADQPQLTIPPYTAQRSSILLNRPGETIDLRNHRVSRVLREHTNRLRHQNRVTSDRPFTFQHSPAVRHSSKNLAERRLERLGLPESYLRR